MSQTFENALMENERGRLTDEQLQALGRMFRARTITAWIMIICGAFVGLLTGFALFADGESVTNPKVGLSVVTLGMFATMVYGIAILRTNKKARAASMSTEVRFVRGVPAKSDYATPLRVPGPGGATVTHFLTVKAGTVKIENESYGVLPSTLYQEIVDGQEATFYYIPVNGIGFKKRLIVNYAV